MRVLVWLVACSGVYGACDEGAELADAGVVGCDDIGQGTSDGGDTGAEDVASSDAGLRYVTEADLALFVDRPWFLEAVFDRGELRPMGWHLLASVTFGSDGRLKAHTACHMSGGPRRDWRLEAGVLVIDAPTVWTTNGCPEWDTNEIHEAAMLELGSVASARVDGPRLTLFDPAGAAVLRFSSQPTLLGAWNIASPTRDFGDLAPVLFFGLDSRLRVYIRGASGCGRALEGTFAQSDSHLELRLGSLDLSGCEVPVEDAQQLESLMEALTRGASMTLGTGGRTWALLDNNGTQLLYLARP
ncbi:MAG: hypothetical protein EP329_02955 [Deltaproteobacteria bacterium]|nr:MAG: hypothetical protein EP329_02955 [Deltaproteobacteria bacterium]